MPTVAEDLQILKSHLDEFRDTATRVLEYIKAVIDEEIEYQDYLICSSTTAARLSSFPSALYFTRLLFEAA